MNSHLRLYKSPALSNWTVQHISLIIRTDALHSGVPRGVWGVQNPPPKFRRYRWSPWTHEQEDPASRFSFAVHCVLIRF